MGSSNRKSIIEYYNAFWKEESLSVALKVEAVCRHNTVMSALRYVKLKQNARILDLGCGIGDLTSHLLKYGKTTAIDISDSAIAIAKARYPHIIHLRTFL